VLLNLDHVFHVYSLPANLLILPLQPFLMIISGLGVLVGLFAPPLGGLVLMLARPIAAFCNQAAIRFAFLPGAVLPAPEFRQRITLIAVGVALIYASVAQIRRIGKSEMERE
jgi:competence protein ComEC